MQAAERAAAWQAARQTGPLQAAVVLLLLRLRRVLRPTEPRLRVARGCGRPGPARTEPSAARPGAALMQPTSLRMELAPGHEQPRERWCLPGGSRERCQGQGSALAGQESPGASR
jgi:hypothetical protein